jgi:AcrR family transcriptional regulator
VDLRSADRSAKGALDHYERSLAELLAEFLEEVVGVRRGEVFELSRTDPGIDPVLCLAGDSFRRVWVSLDRIEPVLNAQLNCVASRSADTGVDLLAQFLELLLDLRLCPAADAGTLSRAIAIEAKRERADIALVDLVPPDGAVAAVTTTFLRFLVGQPPIAS